MRYIYFCILFYCFIQLSKALFQWFDVCDSRSKYHKWKKVKCALGVHEELQMAALDKMLKLMDNVSFGPNTNKKHFIKGIRCSTNSLKALYHELREEEWDYLISYRYLHYICFTTWFPYPIIFLFQIESRQARAQIRSLQSQRRK